MLNKSGLGFEKLLNFGQSWPTCLISNQTIVPGLCLPLLPAWQMPSPQQVAWENSPESIHVQAM